MEAATADSDRGSRPRTGARAHPSLGAVPRPPPPPRRTRRGGGVLHELHDGIDESPWRLDEESGPCLAELLRHAKSYETVGTPRPMYSAILAAWIPSSFVARVQGDVEVRGVGERLRRARASRRRRCRRGCRSAGARGRWRRRRARGGRCGARRPISSQRSSRWSTLYSALLAVPVAPRVSMNADM